jgi:hypothetical protein
MISPRTALAITAFGAAHPGVKLTVPQTPNLVFDAYYESSTVQSELLRFVELDPITWSVPPIKRACIDFDRVVLWTIVHSKFDNFHIVYDVLHNVVDDCTVEADVLSKRAVEIVAPYDRHVAEWVCGPELCETPPVTTHAAWKIAKIPRNTFDRATWETIAHETHGELPFTFRL